MSVRDEILGEDMYPQGSYIYIVLFSERERKCVCACVFLFVVLMLYKLLDDFSSTDRYNN